MTIDFRCVQCGKMLRTPADAAGKQAQCPACGAIQPIPMASEPGIVATPVSPAAGQSAGPTNPYAAAEYSLETSPAGQWQTPGAVSTQLDLGDILRRSWKIFRARMGACVGMLVFLMVVSGMLYGLLVAAAIAFMEMPEARAAILVAGIPLGFVVLLLLVNFGIGFVRVMLKIGRGQDVSLLDFFNTDPGLFLRLLGYIVLVSALQYLIMGLLLLPWIAVTLTRGSEALAAILYLVGNLGSNVVSIYLGVLFFLAPFLVVDQGAGPIEALRQSVNLSRGRRLMMFVIGLIAILIAYAGIFACCVGVLFSGAYAMVMAAVTYLTIMGQPSADQLQWLPAGQSPPS